MCDFDLSQALEGSFEADETGPEHCCCEAMGVQDGLFNLDEGVDLAVSRPPKSMQRVANLVVALNRMKRAPALCGPELSDEQLCSMIMESLVDETIVKKGQDLTMCEKKSTFQRVNSEKQCTICDTSQKAVVQPPGHLKLQAITLKGGNCHQKVRFKLSRYISPVPAAAAQTVALSIMNSNWHMSCFMKEDTAVLHVELCSEEDLKVIRANDNMDRFLFYKSTTGYTQTTFESVKYRGWFISTSSDCENQPVEMCKVDTARRLTYFKIN
ncbi:interleukin-1 beta-like [Centroberyx affinis]|uniref:interleukin-1 beta-like n=1 Tax=Centroberyx affinis TaxID=166261 RepID=UPI003A5C0E9E